MAHPPSADASADGLQRVLGPLDATCIVIGAVVGVGIFFTPSSVAQAAGSSGLALTAWIVCGVIAMCGALCFAELGGIYHRSAGQYEVLRDAYGPLAGFCCVFCNATAILAGSAAVVALTCSTNLSIAIWGHEPTPQVRLICATLLIIALMLVNLLGVVWGSSIQNICVFAKIMTLLVVVGVAIYAGGPNETDQPNIDRAAESTGVISRLMTAIVPAIFAYGGWQQGLWIAGEIRDPRRNLPRAIVGGMAIVTTVYIMANWAYLHLLGNSGVAESKALAADAVASVWPHAGRRGIAAAVALSAFGVMNSQLLTGPRLVYGMAADGRFFGVFSRISERRKTPYAAIFLIGGLALSLLFAASAYPNSIDQLLNGVVAVDGVFFLLTGVAIFILRKRIDASRRSFSVPGYPFTPLVFVVCEAAVVAGSFMNPSVRQAAKIGAGWLLLAIVCYFAFFREERKAERQ